MAIQLDSVIRGIPRRTIKKALARTARLNLLVSPQQKEEIRAAAERFGLSMTDYLLRIHMLVEAQERGAAPRG